LLPQQINLNHFAKIMTAWLLNSSAAVLCSLRSLLIRRSAAVLLAFVLFGCATSHEHFRLDPNLLAFLHDGSTSRQEVVSKLGQPSTRLEEGKILTYRLTSNPDNSAFIVVEPELRWNRAKYSLVLIFDDRGVLREHSLVPINK